MTPITRRTLMGAAAASALGATTVASQIDAAEAATDRPVRAFVFDRAASWSGGSFLATGVDASGQIALKSGWRTTNFRDPYTGVTRQYDYGWWVSPEQAIGFGADQLIASWNAATPHGCYVDVALQARTATGAWTRLYGMARWVMPDQSVDIRRHSFTGQTDAYGQAYTDTVVAKGTHRFTHAKVRYMLMRRSGTTVTPQVKLGAIMASRIPATPQATNRISTTSLLLPVPTYSQERHKGHFPQWDGGGEAWCSATSTAMVVDYWGRGPTSVETAWVKIAGETRPQVDHTARYCYDYCYQGTGNWPFNTGYAGSRNLRSYVTRLRNLREAEQLIAAKVPLIVSVSFSSSELTGAGYSTNGHLMVIVGFAPNGDVICNDPAAHLSPYDSRVRVTYNRRQFEKVWLSGSRSGGLTYLIAPWGHPLPAAIATEKNWL